MKYFLKVIRQIFRKVTTHLLRPIHFLIFLAVIVACAASALMPLQRRHNLTARNTAASTPTIQILSPQANSYNVGTITVRADLTNTWRDNYDLFWYVDNGSWNWMNDSPTTQNSKQADINVSGWTWHTPNNQYTITLVAIMRNSNQRIYSGVPIYVGTAPTTTPATSQSSTASPQPVATTPAPTPTPMTLYVNPASDAAQTAASTTDPTTKRVMTKLAATPTATWFGGWNSNIQNDVNSLVNAASAAQQTPVLVAYNIPERDCNSYSGGGATSAAAYQTWIKSFAMGIGSHSAIVILEPDALGQITCLSSSDQAQRYQLLNFAITTLKANSGTKVYVDAGNPSWVAASDMANRLSAAGVANADGFSLNVSNFITTSSNITYGHQIAASIGNKHFVIDTSRNGNGSNGQWCNPSGRALGTTPTSNTGDSLVDYFLWVKTPGESDGTCNGGPAAGTWWPAYALTLGLGAGW